MFLRSVVRFASALALVTASCALGSSPPTENPRSHEESAARLEKGRDLVSAICSACHELHRITQQQLSKDEWRDLTKGMISEGAAVTDEEVDLMMDYLAKYFGEKP